MKALRTIAFVVGILVVAFFGFGFIAISTPDGKAKTHDRDVIRTCWQEQGRKSLGPADARFVAGTCEQLEANFRARWNLEP